MAHQLTPDEVKSLITFMRLQGVSSFRYGGLEVEFDGSPVEMPRFSDQAALASIAHRPWPRREAVDPTEELDGSAAYTDEDLFASA